MATSWSATAGNAALTAVMAAYPWIQLHIGAPGSAGTANPAVNTTREQAVWTVPAGGTAGNSNSIVWTNVTAAEDYTFFTAWSAITAGTFGFSGTVTAPAVIVGDNFTIVPAQLVVALTLAS